MQTRCFHRLLVCCPQHTETESMAEGQRYCSRKQQQQQQKKKQRIVKPSLCLTSKLFNTQRGKNIQAWVRILRFLSSGHQRYGQMCMFSLTGAFTSNAYFPRGLLPGMESIF